MKKKPLFQTPYDLKDDYSYNSLIEFSIELNDPEGVVTTFTSGDILSYPTWMMYTLSGERVYFYGTPSGGEVGPFHVDISISDSVQTTDKSFNFEDL